MDYVIQKMEKSCHLLHVCCAPDLVIAYISGARGDIYFYNPNIHPKAEYEKRYNEVLKLADLWSLNVIKVPYDPENFFKRAKGYENEPEKGKRCEICINMRLEKTAKFALENGYQSFSTTLTSSPRKSTEMINKIGSDIMKIYGVTYLPNIYRKTPLYNDAQKLIKQLNIYRQNYCGCAFSYRRSEKNEDILIQR
ncbi:MAG: epoxyqueuosine reductase QueH [Fervidobacterium sp.]